MTPVCIGVYNVRVPVRTEVTIVEDFIREAQDVRMRAEVLHELDDTAQQDVSYGNCSRAEEALRLPASGRFVVYFALHEPLQVALAQPQLLRYG